ncbi:hypothetical protein AVEN_48293-1 [Araneus ventricosus]|uniref:Uncharacterized protein n=1 Tax=Araneus ventricosus TaxID=182803 RepID=A0A4Y2JAA4_ARAVE|nr:hypothetical protein AVEN_48293-1 [Araneus ventricosus]
METPSRVKPLLLLLHLKTDMEAVCSSALRLNEAMLVPRHTSFVSAGPTAQASGCGGDEDPEDPPGGVAETGASPAGGTELRLPYGDWYMEEQALVVMEGNELVGTS